jgi:3-keto-disaccharide hydrolase
MRTQLVPLSIVLFTALCHTNAIAGVNELTPAEKKAGWQLLFNGKDATGWICNTGKKPSDTVIEDGTLMPYKSGGYVLMYKKQFGDFILKCDVKMPKSCNSGVFFRMGNPKDPVQSGFEVQVMNSKGKGRHDFGAIYDLVAPSKNNLKPTGQWNAVEIKCVGPHITVKVNGETVATMNCDEWTEPGKRLDGSKHKFRKAIKDFPRKGYLGFQDHGAKVWFRNVKVLELTKK